MCTTDYWFPIQFQFGFQMSWLRFGSAVCVAQTAIICECCKPRGSLGWVSGFLTTHQHS